MIGTKTFVSNRVLLNNRTLKLAERCVGISSPPHVACSWKEFTPAVLTDMALLDWYGITDVVQLTMLNEQQIHFDQVLEQCFEQERYSSCVLLQSPFHELRLIPLLNIMHRVVHVKIA